MMELRSSMLAFLNIFFFVFHSSLIVFNLFGWTWKKTRLANLITLLLTALSWFVLGIWYGFGFCPCTEWHWQVRIKMGLYDMPASYIKFLVDSMTGLDVNAEIVDVVTLAALILALAGSITTNWLDWRRVK
ncbi:MAG: DUF2784 domain-containing protein [bacterium]